MFLVAICSSFLLKTSSITNLKNIKRETGNRKREVRNRKRETKRNYK